MGYTVPTTRAAGELITSTVWNNDIVENIKFLANPPACRVFNSAALPITDAVTTYLTFNSETFDTDNMHSTVSNTGRITFNTAGIYVVTGYVELTGRNDWQNEAVLIRLNGTTNIAEISGGTVANGTIGPGFAVTTTYKFAVGNYVELGVYGHNGAGAAFNVARSGAYSPEFSAVWVGLG